MQLDSLLTFLLYFPYDLLFDAVFHYQATGVVTPERGGVGAWITILKQACHRRFICRCPIPNALIQRSKRYPIV